MPYVTGAEIIAKAAVPSPTTDDTEWADLCADALESVIARRLEGITPSAGQVDELERAALLDGLAAYAERKAPHGVLSFGPDGDAVRLGRDIVRALEPVLFRIAGPGIG